MSNAINAFLAGQQFSQGQREQRDRNALAQEQRGFQNTAGKVQNALMQGDREGARSMAMSSGNADVMAGFRDQIGAMDERQRQAARENLQGTAALGMAMRRIPAEQRQAWVMQNAPQISGFGLDPQQIAGMDLSDQNIDAYVSMARNMDRDMFADSTAPYTLAENEVRGDHTGAQTVNPNAALNRGIDQQNADTGRMSAVTDRRRVQMDEVAAEQPAWDDINSLRDDAEGMIRNYRKVEEAYSRIAASAQDPSAAGDLALIFNYMKMLDPGSTVREGEFATAQNAGGVDQRVLSFYNRINNGERLTPDQRIDFVRRADMLFGQQQRVAQERIAPFAEQAEQRGFPARQAVPQFVSSPELESSNEPSIDDLVNQYAPE